MATGHPVDNALRALSDEALTRKMFDVERDLVQARFQHSMGQLENTAQLRTYRKEIARIRTEARRRELEKGIQRGGLIRTNRKGLGKPAPVETAAPKAAGGFLKGIVDKLTSKE